VGTLQGRGQRFAKEEIKGRKTSRKDCQPKGKLGSGGLGQKLVWCLTRKKMRTYKKKVHKHERRRRTKTEQTTDGGDTAG